MTRIVQINRCFASRKTAKNLFELVTREEEKHFDLKLNIYVKVL